MNIIRNQASPHRILSYVMSQSFEGIAVAFLGTQNMVIRLFLPDAFEANSKGSVFWRRNEMNLR